MRFDRHPITISLVAAPFLAISLGLPTTAVAATTPHARRDTTLHARVARPVVYTLALEDQILAYLRYLPVAFVPLVTKPVKRHPTPTTTTTTTTVPASTTTTTVAPSSAAPTTTTTTHPTTTTTVHKAAPPRRRAPVPVAPFSVAKKGHYVWRFRSLPWQFKSQWNPLTYNVILEGALMRFQSDHGLPATGQMNGTTWDTLVAAARAHQFDHTSYNVVVVNQTLPQHLQLFENGKVTFTSVVNTGIAASPTANGTFPVYLRYVTTTMSGINPNGTPYHDTGIPWVSYFNGGDALHGFIRSTYGWPQSLGCVEMPFAEAHVLWPHTPIGTLVTVL